MNNSIYILLIVSLSSICCTSENDTAKVRHKRRLIMDYNWPEPDPSIKKYPHERNCHYYYQAEIDDIFTIRKCHKGEIFDYHKHECTKESNGQCYSDHYGKTKIHDHIHSKVRKLFKCPTSDGNFPDIFDCRRYFHCTNGIPKHNRCHSNKLFDKLRRHCKNRRDALCADITDVANVYRKDYKCPRPHGLFADPKVCSRYYECLQGKPSLKVCNTGELFDETKKRCVVKEQVYCGFKLNPYENIGSVLTLTNSSTLSDAEASAETSSLPGETHSEKETVRSNVTVKEYISTATKISGDISSSSPPSQTEKSATNEHQRESTETDSKSGSISISSSGNLKSVLTSTHSSSWSDAETSAETSSLTGETHSEKETVKINVPVKEYINVATKISGNILSSLPPSLTEKSTTNEHQRESTETDSTSASSRKNHESVLSPTHSSALRDTETSTVTVSLLEETHSEKEAVRTNVTVKKFISTAATKILGNISPSSPPNQTEKSKTNEHQRESNEAYSKSDAISNSSNDKSSPESASTTMPCLPETCIVENDMQLRCPTANGVHPYNKDKSRFIQCDNFKIYIRPCPHNQVFDVKQNVCILLLPKLNILM